MMDFQNFFSYFLTKRNCYREGKRYTAQRIVVTGFGNRYALSKCGAQKEFGKAFLMFQELKNENFQQKFNVTDSLRRQRNPSKIHLNSQAIEIYKKRPKLLFTSTTYR
jgi:hypothetical protein